MRIVFLPETDRLEAFSDGVFAIIITIMVLELRPPEGADLAALGPLVPSFLGYLLSFAFLATYWNNHHHLVQAAKGVTPGIMWANMHLLFWLSLIPFATAWMGHHPDGPWPAAVYGIILVFSAVAYYVLQNLIVAMHGPHSALKKAVGKDVKGKLSMGLYALSVACAFVEPRASFGIFAFVAFLWVLPDRRLAAALALVQEELEG